MFALEAKTVGGIERERGGGNKTKGKRNKNKRGGGNQPTKNEQRL